MGLCPSPNQSLPPGVPGVGGDSTATRSKEGGGGPSRNMGLGANTCKGGVGVLLFRLVFHVLQNLDRNLGESIIYDEAFAKIGFEIGSRLI